MDLPSNISAGTMALLRLTGERTRECQQDRRRLEHEMHDLEGRLEEAEKHLEAIKVLALSLKSLGFFAETRTSDRELSKCIKDKEDIDLKCARMKKDMEKALRAQEIQKLWGTNESLMIGNKDPGGQYMLPGYSYVPPTWRPSSQELACPWLAPAKVRKDPCKGKKTLAPPPPPPPPPPPQLRPPVITYTESPKVIHTSPCDFKELVQRLTGAPPSSSSSSSSSANAAASRSPSNANTVGAAGPSADEGPRKGGEDVIDQLGIDDGVSDFLSMDLNFDSFLEDHAFWANLEDII
ncbi:formin-like protein 2 [Phoenix dactylifera]|uniref:Formin-like protein 2 n=1 Tax=Phoenix dactylifera TaxID=42345 RepID=A0A8B9AL13_PHODC|nr:formin-like protein 2 [Phoenix dactylifera]